MPKTERWDGYPPNAGDPGFYFLKLRDGKTTVGHWTPRDDLETGGVWHLIGMKPALFPMWFRDGSSIIRQIFPDWENGRFISQGGKR